MDVLFERAWAGAGNGGHDGVFFFVRVDGAGGFEIIWEGGVGRDGYFCF